MRMHHIHIHIHTTPARTIQRRPSSDHTPCSPAAVTPTDGSFQVGCISKAGAHALGVFDHELAKSLCGAAPGSAAASVLVSSRLPLAP
jgi:hypothetical protein